MRAATCARTRTVTSQPARLGPATLPPSARRGPARRTARGHAPARGHPAGAACRRRRAPLRGAAPQIHKRQRHGARPARHPAAVGAPPPPTPAGPGASSFRAPPPRARSGRPRATFLRTQDSPGPTTRGSPAASSSFFSSFFASFFGGILGPSPPAGLLPGPAHRWHPHTNGPRSRTRNLGTGNSET